MRGNICGLNVCKESIETDLLWINFAILIPLPAKSNFIDIENQTNREFHRDVL